MIVISGTMGSGKTTVLSEASDILKSQGVVHAAIDVDTLGIAHLPNGIPDDVEFRNLASVWSNYRSAGVARLLLAQAVETAADLDRIRKAVPEADIVVCRLTVPLEIARERVRTREPGMYQEHFVARVEELDRILDDAGVEKFSIDNARASVTDVARRMLALAGWI